MSSAPRLDRLFAVGAGAWLALLTPACGPAADAPLRSPSQDYPHPPPTTSDGEVVGADGVAPSDRLQEGPRVGSEDELAPGWKVDEHKGGLKHDPKERTGGATDQKAVEEPRSPHTP